MAATKKKRRRNRHDPERARKADQRAEARRREREERLAAAAVAERRKKLRDRIRGMAIPALVGISVIVVAYIVFRPANEIQGVEQPPEVAAVELAPGETHDYGTATPTSGPYAPEAPACGVLTEPLALEEAVAALRIGAVVVWHRPGDTDTANALSVIAADFDSHVIVAPNDGIEEAVVATAWNRLLRFDTPGAAVEDFVQVYRDRGPAEGDCPIG